ncbi:MAG: hypothetical protein NZ912_01325 [Ignisphaera sp.]|nr:hypothetical protein [Ignisphaera sp.]
MNREPIEELIEKQKKEPETVARERLDIILKTVELKTPSRVAVAGFRGDVVLAYSNLTWYDVSYELTDKTISAIVDFYSKFPTDFGVTRAPYGLEGFLLALAFSDFPEFSNTIRFLWGPLHDVLKDRWSRWPGRELRTDQHPQFLGGEFMNPNEYKMLIDDPIQFMFNVIIPRACPGLGAPGSPQWNGSMIRMGLVLQRIMMFARSVSLGLSKIGIPAIPTLNAYAPADIIGDFLRHLTGAMVDMRRYPDDFKAACEVLVEPTVKVASAVPSTPPLTFFFIPLHLNEMLPPRLYNEFYWPYLKKVIETLVGKGYRGYVFFEGDHSPHIDTILELPKGWGLAYFEKPRDFLQVWEKLKGHSAVMGGMPTNLLLHGTPEKIEEYIKNLLTQIRPEGGFIISPGVSEQPPNIPVENMRAYINSVLKYGTY